MTRTVIALENDIKLWLDQRAEQDGVPMTELVRRALREMRDRELAALDALLGETSGLLAGEDGLAAQEALRDEWDRAS